MDFKTKDFKVLVPFSVKAAEVTDKTGDDIIIIEGYCNWSGSDDMGKIYTDLAGDVVVPGGVDTSVWEKNPQLLLQHDRNMTIGRGLSLEKRSDGLFITGEVHAKAMSAEDYYRVKAGLLSMFSIGFRTIDAEWKAYDTGEIFYITKSLLFEVSVVSIPCNSMSGFSVIKGLPDGEFTADRKTNQRLQPESPTKEKVIPMRMKVKFADYLSDSDLEQLKSKGVDVSAEVEMDLVDFIKRQVAAEVEAKIAAIPAPAVPEVPEVKEEVAPVVEDVPEEVPVEEEEKALSAEEIAAFETLSKSLSDLLAE